MEETSDDIGVRVQKYVANRGCVLIGDLGFGVDGIVYATDHQSAIKVFRFERLYIRKRDVYMRLAIHSILIVNGFEVPKLLDYDDTLWIVEMTIVHRPFVLDFASAYLDKRPDFPEEVLLEWKKRSWSNLGNAGQKSAWSLDDLREWGSISQT
jgi:hypothetical protein